MDSPRPTLDLERELTCSICTDVLYQPLTLLDCLHTFCGACLKDWFAFQASANESAPTAPPPGTPLFTCPSCRAAVRGSKHNATVATLLDMFLKANPEKERSESEKAEIAVKYTRGDAVLPATREKSPEELRAEEEDRRLVEEVRALSLRAVGVDGSGHAGGTTPRSRHRHGPRESSRSGDERGDQRRRRRGSESRRRGDETEARTRQIEHQSSIRSLIGSADMSERDTEREIEEFARQIQEEGILDGLDLDNIDLARDDELSRKITDAYRRRQRERSSRQESRPRTNNPPGDSAPPPSSEPNLLPEVARPPRTMRDDRSPGGRRRRYSAGARVHSEERSRSQSVTTRTPGAGLLEVQRGDDGRQRRRTASSGRSSTTPIAVHHPRTAGPGPSAAARSQTDLTLATRAAELLNLPRPVAGERGRTISSPATTEGSNLSFASRVPLQLHPQSQAGRSTPPKEFSPGPHMQRAHRPAELSLRGDPTPPTQSPLPSPVRRRTPPLLFTEPSITCSRCAKPHIEYGIHYTCAPCSAGAAAIFTLCLMCYRAGRGCHHWFGFGHDALAKWDRARRENPALEPPHKLWAGRYLPPRAPLQPLPPPPQPPPRKSDDLPGGGVTTSTEVAVTQTAEDPVARLQSGAFCDGCFAWASECFWRCSTCNGGEWGFCNGCVNAGRCCPHPLLPLSYQAQQPQPQKQQQGQQQGGTPPGTPTRPGPAAVGSLGTAAVSAPPLPRRAAVLSAAAGSAGGGPGFRPLTFATRCDICRDTIPPQQPRHHCFSCAGAGEPGDAKALPGDYDVCTGCYADLAARRRISAENGPQGWRRCPRGHRMITVEFREGADGLYRVVSRDLVGGHRLWSVAVEGDAGVERWCWKEGGVTVGRLVTVDVAGTAPGEGAGAAGRFPPADGGAGMVARARWGWLPKGGEEREADDELYFPRGAEVREVEDVNGDWYVGRYMGREGVFPASYVVVV